MNNFWRSVINPSDLNATATLKSQSDFLRGGRDGIRTRGLLRDREVC